jgi:hypothetical protein
MIAADSSHGSFIDNVIFYLERAGRSYSRAPAQEDVELLWEAQVSHDTGYGTLRRGRPHISVHVRRARFPLR